MFASSPETAPLSLQGQISATLTTFTRTIQDYSNAAQNEIIQERKERAQTRIENFKSELEQARQQFQRLKQEREEGLHNTNRQELLGRRHPPGGGNEMASENPYSKPGNVYSDMPRADGLSRERDVLGRAGEQLDEFIERGRAVLGDLGDQNELLKRTQKSLLSAANTLGISNETIRLVGRRAREDKWMFYGGILFMIVCFYYILKWFG